MTSVSKTAEELAIPTLLNFESAVDWPSRLAAEGPFLAAAFAAAPSARLVDLGCGTGEHARWLAGRGFEVVGIEGVRERWELARQNPVPGTEFLLGDLGAVEAMVRGQFGGALCLGNTLPALIGVETVSRMLIGLRRRLLPGGVFVLQQWNFDGLALRGPRELPERRVARDDGDLHFRAAVEVGEDGVATVREEVFRSEAGATAPADPAIPIHRRHRHLQGWRLDEIRTLLDLARFREIQLYSGVAGEPFDAASSDELVVVAS